MLGVIARLQDPPVDQPGRWRHFGEDGRRILLAGVVEEPGQEFGPLPRRVPAPFLAQECAQTAPGSGTHRTPPAPTRPPPESALPQPPRPARPGTRLQAGQLHRPLAIEVPATTEALKARHDDDHQTYGAYRISGSGTPLRRSGTPPAGTERRECASRLRRGPITERADSDAAAVPEPNVGGRGPALVSQPGRRAMNA